MGSVFIHGRENGTVYVLDCDLQKALGIKGLDYYAQ